MPLDHKKSELELALEDSLESQSSLALASGFLKHSALESSSVLDLTAQMKGKERLSGSSKRSAPASSLAPKKRSESS